MITYNDIKQNQTINTYITEADKTLLAMGYTEHSFAHVGKVANDAAYILSKLNRPEREIELVKIAGYLHDIGNVVNRTDHPHSGALMSFKILTDLGMDTKEIAQIISAIGNHDESTGIPISTIAAALIIADKCDVRRSRVRNSNFSEFDIHDRVNYSVTSSKIEVDEDLMTCTLSLEIDSTISPVIDYFEIFLQRMTMCKNAAKKLGLEFKFNINNQSII